MDNEPGTRLDPRAPKAWLLNGLIKGAVLLLVPAVYIFLASRIEVLPVYSGWVLAGLVVLFTLWEALIAPGLRMRYWRYDIRQEEIDIQYGIFIRRRILVPMIRVQHVDTEHGPILRLFGLATLQVFTAASEHRIPALSREEAARLRGEISALTRASDEDV